MYIFCLSINVKNSHLGGVKWHLSEVLIAIPQWLAMAEHLFMYLFATHSSSTQIISFLNPDCCTDFLILYGFRYIKNKGLVSIFSSVLGEQFKELMESSEMARKK